MKELFGQRLREQRIQHGLTLEQLAEKHGNLCLHQMLEKVDPASAAAIHYNNRKRVIRALEFYKETGIPISEHNEKESKRISPYNFEYFVLNDARSKLYDRIDRRIDIMVEQGLIENVIPDISPSVRSHGLRGKKKSPGWIRVNSHQKITLWISCLNSCGQRELFHKIKWSR